MDKIDCGCGGEHSTTKGRAWCLDCHEWCYPDSPCEIQELRNENKQLRQRVKELEGCKPGCSIAEGVAHERCVFLN